MGVGGRISERVFTILDRLARLRGVIREYDEYVAQLSGLLSRSVELPGVWGAEHPMCISITVKRRLESTAMLSWLCHLRLEGFDRSFYAGRRLAALTVEEVRLSKYGLAVVFTRHYEGLADKKDQLELKFGSRVSVGDLALAALLLAEEDFDVLERELGKYGELAECVERLRGTLAIFSALLR